MMTSEQTDKLDAALAKAQAEFNVAGKDALNPHFKTKYASLASVWGAVRPALGKAGISITQHPLQSEQAGRLILLTRIAHAGQWMSSTCEVPLGRSDVQSWGGALTYAKRYALSAILGIAVDEDDDGEGASGRGEKKPDDKTDPIAEAKEPAKVAKKEVKNHAPQAPEISPMQQVGAAIARFRRDKEVVGRWIRAKYPNVQFQTMSQALADEVIKKIEDTPDEGLEIESKDQGRSRR